MRRLAAALLFALAASVASAQITFDAASNGTNSGAVEVASINFSHTVGGGPNRIVIVGVSHVSSTGTHTVSATYNGVAMTADGSGTTARTSGTPGATMFYVKEASLPAAGTYTVVVSSAGVNATLAAGAVSYSRIDQTTVWDTNNYGSGSGTVASNTQVSAVGNLAIGHMYNASGVSFTAGTGGTLRYQLYTAAAPTLAHAFTQEAGAASVTLDININSSSSWRFSSQNLRWDGTTSTRKRVHIQ